MNDIIIKIGNKTLEGVTPIEYEDTKDQRTIKGIYTYSEYYMRRYNNYYFRNMFGAIKITLDNVNLEGQHRLDSLTYGEKYNIQVNPLKLIPNEN